MKRTSAPALITSFASTRWVRKLADFRRPLWVAAAVCCGSVLFMLGRSTAGVPAELANQVRSLQQEIHLQQGKVDRLRTNTRQNVNALAARLAELQAASTRLDALGERLAHMGQLTLDEFDFGKPAPVGGPGDYEAMGPADEAELGLAIESLSEKLRRQSSQLDALQFLMANRQLDPGVETVFLMADEQYTHVSSSLLKQIASLSDDDDQLAKFVPPEIIAPLRANLQLRI